ncbi:MAG: SUMF1/EgtB/PvdO family nonheme iron enzyme, partial [Myxococcales bacterium]|nr:SUMF1/EgtB/PvdO family nonheme iron enzyme [Myxococcales bacterium]
PMGSYLLKLQGPGLSPTVVPIAITRQKRLRLRLRMFPDRLREADEIHIVGGPTRLGGDPLAQLARPARTIEVDDFFLARRPVTAQAYREFLHHLAQTVSPAAAAARAPRDTPTGETLWRMDDIGRFTLPGEDIHGVAWHPDWPVVGISCEDAEAYCAWLDETIGPGHRLPTEIEWEKAARGADGRLFPWGDTWEPTFCHMGISRPGPPARGPSGAFATDVSPYGVEDLAGGVSEWTSTWLEGAEQRVIKGGHWASGPTECRAASRFTQPVDRVLPTLGFRVARSAPA